MPYVDFKGKKFLVRWKPEWKELIIRIGSDPSYRKNKGKGKTIDWKRAFDEGLFKDLPDYVTGKDLSHYFHQYKKMQVPKNRKAHNDYSKDYNRKHRKVLKTAQKKKKKDIDVLLRSAPTSLKLEHGLIDGEPLPRYRGQRKRDAKNQYLYNLIDGKTAADLDFEFNMPPIYVVMEYLKDKKKWQRLKHITLSDNPPKTELASVKKLLALYQRKTKIMRFDASEEIK